MRSWTFFLRVLKKTPGRPFYCRVLIMTQVGLRHGRHQEVPHRRASANFYVIFRGNEPERGAWKRQVFLVVGGFQTCFFRWFSWFQWFSWLFAWFSWIPEKNKTKQKAISDEGASVPFFQNRANMSPLCSSCWRFPEQVIHQILCFV